MEFFFGVPTAREKRVEKYPDREVLTVHPTPSGKGQGCKFEMNKKLIESLGLTLDNNEFVSMSIQPEGERHVARLAITTGRDVQQYRIRKNGSFSNKKIHQYLLNKLNLDGNIANEFEVSYEKEDSGIRIYQLNLI